MESGVSLRGHTLWCGGYPLAYFSRNGDIVVTDTTHLPMEMAPIGKYIKQVVDAQKGHPPDAPQTGVPIQVRRAIEHYLGGAEFIYGGVQLHGHELSYGFTLARFEKGGKVVVADMTYFPREIILVGEYVKQAVTALQERQPADLPRRPKRR